MQISHFFLHFILIITLNMQAKIPFTVMLDPAGDAQYPGRIIGSHLERGITYQCAEKLKREIEQKHPHVRVVLTRFSGETVQEFQNASFANRLGANIYISIHFYKSEKPEISIFYYLRHPVTDFWKYNISLHLVPLPQAHRISLPTTQTLAQRCVTLLQEQHGKSRTSYGPYGIPFKPLLGIQCPAIGFEASICDEQYDWQEYVEPLSNCISLIIETVHIKP